MALRKAEIAACRARMIRRPLIAALAGGLALATTARAEPGIDARTIAPLVRSSEVGADAVGDVNGDGIGDLGFAPLVEPAEGRRCEPLRERIDDQDARNWQDAAQVVFGRPGLLGSPLDPRAPGPGALRIRCFGVPQLEDRGPSGSGVTYGVPVGASIGGAGDFDGDGIDDLVVGSQGAGPRSRPAAGSVHVVFGSREGGEVDARTLGARGVRIDGPERASNLGFGAVPLGDVDGDGFADVALPYLVGVAAPDGRRLDRDRVRVAVVYGGPRGGEQIDLAAPGDRATIVTGFGDPYGEPAGFVPLAAAGDIDGDGADDVAFGMADETVSGPGEGGSVTVIGARARGATVDIRRVRPIMVVRGEGSLPFGRPIASVGDVSGDGRPDLAIGASLPRVARRVVLIVPAQPGATVEVDGSATGVRRIVAPPQDELTFGTTLVPLGDHDGDGRRDLLIGQPAASPDCRGDAGSAWVVPIAPGGGTSPVARIPGAWRIDGARPHTALGEDGAAADVDGDGTLELLLSSVRDSTSAVDVLAPPAVRPALPAAPLRTDEDCFGVRLVTRSLHALRRGEFVVAVRSNAGAAQRQRVVVRVVVATRPRRPRTRHEIGLLEESIIHARQRTVVLRAAGPARWRARVPLGRSTRAMLRRHRFAFVRVQVEQAAPRGWTYEDEVLLAR